MVFVLTCHRVEGAAPPAIAGGEIRSAWLPSGLADAVPDQVTKKSALVSTNPVLSVANCTARLPPLPSES